MTILCSIAGLSTGCHIPPQVFVRDAARVSLRVKHDGVTDDVDRAPFDLRLRLRDNEGTLRSVHVARRDGTIVFEGVPSSSAVWITHPVVGHDPLPPPLEGASRLNVPYEITIASAVHEDEGVFRFSACANLGHGGKPRILIMDLGFACAAEDATFEVSTPVSNVVYTDTVSPFGNAFWKGWPPP
jgi:hypothetical protein